MLNLRLSLNRTLRHENEPASEIVTQCSLRLFPIVNSLVWVGASSKSDQRNEITSSVFDTGFAFAGKSEWVCARANCLRKNELFEGERELFRESLFGHFLPFEFGLAIGEKEEDK